MQKFVCNKTDLMTPRATAKKRSQQATTATMRTYVHMYLFLLIYVCMALPSHMYANSLANY